MLSLLSLFLELKISEITATQMRPLLGTASWDFDGATDPTNFPLQPSSSARALQESSRVVVFLYSAAKAPALLLAQAPRNRPRVYSGGILRTGSTPHKPAYPYVPHKPTRMYKG